MVKVGNPKGLLDVAVVAAQLRELVAVRLILGVTGSTRTTVRDELPGPERLHVAGSAGSGQVSALQRE